MKLLSVHVKKLDDRSKAVVHLGREPGTKAYRLYDPNTGVVHISRDVVFAETKGCEWKEHEKGHTYVPNSFTVVGFPFETTSVNEGNENMVLTLQTPSTPVPSAQTASLSIHNGEHGYGVEVHKKPYGPGFIRVLKSTVFFIRNRIGLF